MHSSRGGLEYECTNDKKFLLTCRIDSGHSLLESGSDATWATTSPLIRGQTSQTAWNSTIGAIRAGLGNLQARELKGVGFTHTLPDAPPGDYAFVVYNSTFSLATVEEKAVLQKDNASWKVAGYFVSKTVKASASLKNYDS